MSNQLQEKLVADKKNLEHILDHLQEGIIGHDRERRIIYFNRVAEEITGYAKDEVIGRDCHEAFGGALCGKQCSFFGGVPDSLANQCYPLNIVTKQGEPKQVEISVVGMTDELGRVVGILAIIRDITSMVGFKLWPEEFPQFGGLVGRNPKMIQVFRQIQAAAENHYPVLITGETGTGKELVAAAIHNMSKRSKGPFIAVNCGALPEGVVESELFGHVKGAFSGAIRDKKGRFELAQKGTIFLDEVAEFSKNVQVKLLRVLENGTFERVGSEKTTAVDVRVISATHRNLKREIEKKNFREDLFYRIKVVPIHLPPLRERKDDIPLLLEYFQEQARKQGQKVARFSNAALEVMMRYSWPGNVRELQHAAYHALAKGRGRAAGPEDLPQELRSSTSQRGAPRKLNLEAVQVALKRSGGNKVKAARTLGIARATLYRFLMSHKAKLSQYINETFIIL
ncbi:MAG: PAS domain S-box protein [Deltaproteobacteria bacterium]|nr:PAS domain S-box protein [Deltaproteobacteria bacterium]